MDDPKSENRQGLAELRRYLHEQTPQFPCSVSRLLSDGREAGKAAYSIATAAYQKRTLSRKPKASSKHRTPEEEQDQGQGGCM